MTLPSNSSMDIFPHNTLANYQTKLHKTVELGGAGEWEVAIVEMMFPLTMYNVGQHENFIRLVAENEKADSKYSVPSQFYSSNEHLLSSITCIPAVNEQFKFAYQQSTGRFSINRTKECKAAINMGKDLVKILGFEIDAPFAFGVAKHPANLLASVPQQLFVYSDIVEPQLVGDTIAPLLRIVAIRSKFEFGKCVAVTYETPHYIRVQRRQFETIEIDIRDNTGKPIPFEFGTVIVKLHFRRQIPGC